MAKRQTQKQRKKQPRRAVVETIEPRILYSADFAPGLLDASPLAAEAEQRTLDAGGEFAQASAIDVQQRRREIVFVDRATPDYQQLIEDIRSQAGERDLEVVLLEGNRNGVQQIGETLAGRSEVSAVHLVSHGADGSMQLGSARLDFDALLKSATQIKRWGEALSADADLMIYGCDVAQSDAGRSLIDALSRLTGADVAASVDRTGHADRGGDWDLEFHAGIVDTPIVFSQSVILDWKATLQATAVGGETRANTTTSGTQQTNLSVQPRTVAMDQNGNYVVAWSGEGPGDTTGIFAQRYNANGVAQGAEFRVNTTTANTQSSPAVAMDANGNFLVAWTSNGQDGSAEGVYAQRFNASGVAQGTEFRVNTATSGSQQAPVIAMNASGSLVIAWGSDGQDGSGQGVYAQRYDASGVAQGSEFRVNVTTSGDQWCDSAAMDANGNFIVAWSSSDGGGLGVYTRRYDAAGTALTGEVLVNTATAGDQTWDCVAMNANGQYVVAWNSAGQDGSGVGIYAQRFDANGVAQGSEFRVNSTTANDQVTPTVGIDAQGNFVITWASDHTGSWSVYKQDYNADGTASGGQSLVNTTIANNQQYGGVAMNAAGQYAVVWSGNGPGDTSGVFFQRYTSGLVVDTVSDMADGTTTSIANLLANKGADGFISLREAIAASNNTANVGGPDRIYFNISGAGVHVITLSSALPSLSDAVVLDGSTDPNFAGTPVIELRGGGTVTNAFSVAAGGAGSTVRGFVINGFTGDTIVLTGGNNLIAGNYIGTNAAGSAVAATPNAEGGIRILTGSDNNTIGGTTALDRNIIAGNGVGANATDNEISLHGGNNLIIGNYIGVAADGTTVIGNLNDGVDVSTGATSNIVGGLNAGERNLIAGHTGGGVRIQNGATGTLIRGNTIWANGSGVSISGASTGHLIQQNSIYGNTGLGIDLLSDGVTANDGAKTAGQPNLLMDFPVIQSASLAGTTLGVSGYIGTAPNDTDFASARVELFRSTDAAGVNGEGRTYLGFVTADASGNFSGGIAVSGFAAGDRVTATATDASGNTSEFALNVTSIAGLIVDTTSDVNDGTVTSVAALLASRGADGRISLREAITAANNTAGLDPIAFNIPATDTRHFYYTNDGVAGQVTLANIATTTAATDALLAGPDPDYAYSWYSIRPAGVLPNITDALLIDGYTQTGAQANTVAAPGVSNAVLKIEIDGSAAAGAGEDLLRLSAGSVGSTLRGLVINQSGKSGIEILGSNGNFIEGNYIGTDASGTRARANANDGINVDTSGNTIGGASPGARNLISGNADNGIEFASTSSGNTVIGNFFGTTVSGSAALGNVDAGILMYNGSNANVIGGLTAAERNVISGNTEGIVIDGNGSPGTANNIIRGNYIGTDLTGTFDLGNTSHGVLLQGGAENNTIGGTSAAERNVISGNDGQGVRIDGLNSNSNIVSGNYIGTNAAGTAGIANSAGGVAITNSAASNAVGGLAAGAGNLIAYNTTYGINVAAAAGTGNAILGNAIYSNTSLGIDLRNDGVTANDGAKTAGQPNLLMDFPVIQAASLAGATLTVSGYIGAAPNDTDFAGARVEFFESADAAGVNGEAQTYLGFLTADANGNFSGTLSVVGLVVGDRVTATASDTAGNTSEFAVNVTVTSSNSAPVNTVPGAQAASEDNALAIGGISVSDANGNLSTVGLSVLNGSVSVTLQGGASISAGSNSSAALTLSGTQADINATLATLSYLGGLDYNGADTLTVTSTDALSASDTDPVAITVSAVNDAPTATITPASYAATEQTTLTLHGTGLSIADVDAGAGPVTATVSVTAGTLSAAAGTTGVTVAGSGSASVTLTGTVTQINDLLAGLLSGTLTYINSSDAPLASATLTLSVDDAGNTGSGGALTGSDTATINISAVNDAPTATITPASYAATEQTTLTLHGTGLSIADVDAGASSVTATVSVTSGTLSAAAGTTGVTVAGSGSVSVTLTGTATQINNLLAGLLSGTLTYIDASDTPPASATLTLSVDDGGNTGSGGALTGSDTATINIGAVNDAPTATITPASFAATEQTTLTLHGTGLSVGDVDAGGASVTATVSVVSGTLAAAGGTTGVTIAGSGTNSVTLTGTLTQINDLLAGNLSGTLTYIINSDTPPPTDTLTLSLNDGGNTGSGGALTGSDTATINITAVNDAPTVTAIADQTVAEDSNTGALAFTVGDPETAAGSLVVTATSSNTTLIPNGNLVLGGVGANRTITVTPAADAYGGPVTITVSVSDGVNTTQETLDVTITGLADTASVTNASTNEDTQTTSGLVLSRGAADGAEVTHFKITGITGGTLYLNNGTTVLNNGDFVTFVQGNAGLKFTPSSNSTANGSFDLQASTAANDSGLGGGVVTATIAVNAVNDEPSFTSGGNQTVNEDAGAQAVNGFASALPGGGADEAAQTFTYTVSNNNNALFVVQPTIDASGNLAYTAAANAFGSATVTVSVTDSGGTANGGDDTAPSQTFSITVNSVADAPAIALPGAALAYVENQPAQQIDATATVSDVEGNWNGGTLSVQITANSEAGDRLTIMNTGGVSVSVSGTDVLVGATTVGTTVADTVTGGNALTITFNASATSADVQAVARAIGYYSSSQDPSTAARTATFTATDGGALSNSATEAIGVTRVNDAPTLTATSSNPTYAQGAGAPVTLFSGASASTVEAGQTFSQLVLSVSNLADGAAERLRIDGTFVALTNGNTATTAVNGYGVNVSVAGATATVTLTTTGASAAQTQALVNGLAYEDISAAPAGGPRTLTLTSISDSGGTAGGGVDTSSPSIASTATVTTSGAIPVAVNDAYAVTEENTLTASGVAGWWNTSWQYRRQIAIDNLGGGQLTDFPILVALSSANVDYAQTQNQGQDLRFVDASGALLAHEIESWNEAGTSYVWVKVPVVDANSNSDYVTMYYGNAGAADGQNADAVWNAAYVGVWHLNQAGTGAVNEYRDSSGTGNHGQGGAGVAAETPVQGTGRISTGQDFDGANDFITVQNAASLQLTTAMTLEGWVRLDSFGAADVVDTLLRKGEGNPNNYQLSVGQQTPFFTLDDGENTGVVAPSTVNAGQWYHLGASFDGSTRRLYVNGVEVASDVYSGPIGTDLRDLYIGGRPGTDGSDGLIDEARVSNTARSADWIAAQYANVTSAGYLTFGAQQSATGGGVLFNDSDADGELLTAVLVAGPANAAAFTLNANGSFTYTPNANFAGSDTFTYRANDGSNNSNVATVTITVNPVNDEPSFTLAGNQTLNEDAGAQTVAGFATPSAGGGVDEAGQTFTYTLSNDNNALFTAQPSINASGTLSYTGAANVFGTATVTVFVTDSGGTAGGGDDTSPSQTFTITVNPVADTPAVTNATTNEDTQTTSGLVISRNAADGVEVTHFKITGITAGTLYLNNGTTPVNDGDFITFAQGNAGLKFTPSLNSTANGSFQLQASTANNDSGLGGGIATATITVNPVNDSPVVTAGASTAYTENAAAVVIDNTITVNDADDTQISGATATISAGLSAGDVLGFVNTASITGVYNAGTGVLTLNGTDSLANYQAALRSVTYSSTSEDPTATSASRSLSWQVTDANSDGTGAQTSAVVTSTVNLTALADAPVVTAGASTAYTENAAAVVIDNGVSVSDADDTQISGATVTISAGLTAGDVLGFVNTASITGVYNAGTGVLTLSGTDSLANCQAALRSVTYSSTSEDPTATSASRSIGWQVTDANSDGTGAQTSAVVTSTVNLTALADAPVVTAGAVTGYTENAAAVVIDNGVSVSDADDTQISGATVTISAGLTAGDVLGFVNTASITGVYNAGTGVLTLSGTDSLANYQVALRSVTYSSTSEDPTATSASRTIGWQVTDANSDGLGAQSSVAVTSTVNITAVNDAPVALDDSDATDEDSAFNVPASGVLGNDSDIDGGPLAVSAVEGNPANVGNPVLLASGALLTLNADGSFTYDPNGAFDWLDVGDIGADSFAYEVSDGNGGFDVADVMINISGINDAPTGADATVAIDEDSVYVFADPDFGFSDADASDAFLAVRIVSLPGAGSLTLSGAAVSAGQLISEPDIALGNLVFTPAADTNGAGYSSFAFRVNDGTVDAVAANTMTIDVIAVNDAPGFAQAGNQTVNEDAGAQSVPAFALASPGGGADEAGQSLVYTVSNDNNALFLVQPTLDAAGNLTYTAAADANGVATVTVFVTDNGGTANGGVDTSAAQVFTLTINAVNDVPTLAIGANQNVAEDTGGQSVAGFASRAPGGGPDEAAQALSYVVSNDNNTLFSVQPTLDGSGNLTYTPAPDAFGVATVTVLVSDSGGTANGGVDTSASQSFTITVSPINDAPVMGANTLTIDQGGTVLLSSAILSASDVDTPSGTLIFTVSNVARGQFELTSTPGVAVTSFTQAEVLAGQVRFVHDSSGTPPGYDVRVDDGALIIGPFTASVSFNPAPLVSGPPSSLPPAPGPIAAPPPPPPPPPNVEQSAADDEPGEGLVDVGFSPGSVPANFNDLSEISVRLAKVEARVRVKLVTPQPEAKLNDYTPAASIQPEFQLLDLTPAQLNYTPSTPVDWLVAPAFEEGAEEQLRDELQVLLDSVKFGGMALSVGVVWWASRISGLLGTLLASTPAWRHIDPLPVLGRDDEDEDNWLDPNDRDADANELAVSLVLDGGRPRAQE